MFAKGDKTARRDQCCLCGKTKEQVRKLIVGLHGAVCIDCIDLCSDILNGPEPMRVKGGWDGTVTVDEKDQDVFKSAEDVRRALSNWAELVRSEILSGSSDPPAEG